MVKGIKTDIIETEDQIRSLVDCLAAYHTSPIPHSPILYIDLEGVNLSRHGSLTILTMLIDVENSERRVCLVDLLTLGASAFETAGAKGVTLKVILQDERTTKVFFDLRNDSDALFAHFGVVLRGVEDVQLMESASRKTTASRRRLNGLARCVENTITGEKLVSWKAVKQMGERLFRAGIDGSNTSFNDRPIAADIIQYCAGDVQYLPDLRCRYYPQTSIGVKLVKEETEVRVAASLEPDYQTHGRQKALASWSRQQNVVLDQLHSETFRDDSPDDYSDDCYPISCRDVIDDCDYVLYYDD